MKAGHWDTGDGGAAQWAVGPSTPVYTVLRRSRQVITPSDSSPAHVVDLTQVTDQIYGGRRWSYNRPDTGKVGTPTCKRTSHCKDSKHGGRVRRHGFQPSVSLVFFVSRPPTKAQDSGGGAKGASFGAKAGGLLRFQGEMDGVMLMKGASSPGLAVGRDVGARQHHPAAKVSTLGPRAAAGAGGGSAVEASGPPAAGRHSYVFPLRLDRLWPGRRGAVAGKRKGSVETTVAERAGDSQVLKEVPSEHRSDNWVLKILRARSVWAEREGAAAGDGDREAAAVEDGDRWVGCGSGGHEDGSEGCVVDGVEEEEKEKLVFDRESFSRLLRRVSLVETELYAKMAYLGSLAYIVSKIKVPNSHAFLDFGGYLLL
ncbi:hypothetical protein B296_00017790 [Ensete ventricosum]|uniref:Uncharacterized protein n=1 Tax=Ensete ventricosum TaxID=4639 RepID=A0A426YNA8_ENSVE|nr:hypothetical protein B296_00017790 [Ensete ventricosum]